MTFTDGPRSLVFGIDPGLAGGIAALRISDGSIVYVMAMPLNSVGGHPHPPSLRGPASDERLSEGWIEMQGQRQGQGLGSGIKIVKHNGVLVGAFGMFSTVHEVTPSEWKKAMGLSRDKKESLARARERWPEHADSTFRLEGSDGLAEACLLADYGRGILLGGSGVMAG